MNHSNRVVWCGQLFALLMLAGSVVCQTEVCHGEVCGSPVIQGCTWLTSAYTLAVLEKILCLCGPTSNPYIKNTGFISLFSEWYCRVVGCMWLGFYSELGCHFSCGFLEEKKRFFRLSEQKLSEHLLKIYWQVCCWNYIVLKLWCISPLPTLKIPHKWSDEIHFFNYY